MGITHVQNTYVIPRGRVYFDPFNANGEKTGEIALGNCPGFSFGTETEKAEHFSSESGLAQKDAAIVVKITRTGKLPCDNISTDNLALFVAGTKGTQTQASATVTAEEHKIRKGRLYQLGATSSNPAGARDISAVAVKSADGLTTHVAGTDYNIDLALGRLQILEAGAIANDSVIKVDYTAPAKTWEQVKSGAAAEVPGALRVVSDVASGVNRDWYFPSTVLMPSGELPIIQEGTEFVVMEFELDILKPANAEAMYIDGRPQAI